MDKKSDTILQGLNPSQKEAVINTEGPVLVIAGAGSGKTRVLTSRIAYILARGGDPSGILALTFTKKAAAEMRERIGAMVGERSARRIWMGTFHSVFIRFLREHAALLGYPESFTIYDTSDSASALKRCIKELKLDEKTYKPKAVLSRISNAKNHLVSVEAYEANTAAQTNDRSAKMPDIVKVYAAYQRLMKQAGVMDFDDILFNMYLLLNGYPEVRKAISGRFGYILVDEYQDTNVAQYEILKLLVGAQRNICVVGDDSQSIYAFRGAQIRNILRFKDEYPGCKVFRLEQNYRSTQNIVDAANSLIAKNNNRLPKTCYSRGEQGEKIRLLNAYTEQEEASMVASSIVSRMQKDAAAYGDFAILYRTNAQSRALEEALRRRNLPYVIYSGHAFFDRAEVRDMMAWFKLAVNPADGESFRRAVGRPSRGIGEATVEALQAAALAHGTALLEAIFSDDLATFGLRDASVRKLRAFAAMVLEAHEAAKAGDAFDVASRISDVCGLYLSFKNENTVEGESRAANIGELLSSVKSFVESRQNEMREEMVADGVSEDVSDIPVESLPPVTLGEWLENISLLSSGDDPDGEDVSNRIVLMTVHSAKGLEFPYVYVTGMEENLFPSLSMLARTDDIEEERRLFYVAVTRAKIAVALSCASTRMRNGKHESNSISRFVKEIDPRYMENPPLDDVPRAVNPSLSGSFRPFASSGSTSFFRKSQPRPSLEVRPEPRQVSYRTPARAPLPVADADFVPVAPSLLKAGQRIEHNRFGLGDILEITDKDMDLKAKIRFDMYGEKILLLRYAKIRFPKQQ